MSKLDRRTFLTGSAASFAGAAGLLAGLGQRRAFAADTSGYRALVCLFLFGGLDHADTVLPLDESEFDQLAEVRNGLFNTYNSGSPSVNRTQVNLLALDAQDTPNLGGRRFALAPGMNDMQSLFDAGEMAIVGNVGPLIEPTDRTSFQDGTAILPRRLFSHNDQQSTWMALNVEGAQIGWGGRFADAALLSDTSSDPTFAAISTAGNQVFLAGEVARQFASGVNGRGLDLEITTQEFLLGSGSRGVEQRAAVEAFYAQDNFNNPTHMARDYARISTGAIENVRNFGSATSTVVPFATSFPDSSLGQQFQSVAETIEARNSLRVSRQVFFVGIGGFDTHSGQANQLPGLQAQISEALGAFRNAMVERGVWQDVTVFTASDFGRTLVDNGDGTDHGWGGHHFVAGGSVNGGQIFGDIPLPNPDLDQYTAQSGRLIPTTSVEQYAATLGTWFGLNEADLGTALPNLSQFQNDTIGFV